MRRLKLILLAVVLPIALIGGCAAAAIIKLKSKTEGPRTTKAERGEVAITVRETGYVEPIKRVEVKSKVAGMLAELAVEEGDQVEEGQLIARLDVPELEAQRDQVKAQLDAARARLEQARLSCARDRELIVSQVQQAEASLRAAEAAVQEVETRRLDADRVYQNKRRLLDMGGYVSQNEVDSAKAALDLATQQQLSARERVREQEAALAIARTRRTDVDMSESRVVESEASLRQIKDSLAEIESRLRDAVIRAPCSGTVIGRHVRQGELITAVSYYGSGAPIVTIGDLSTMLVKTELNEVDVDKVRLGQTVEIAPDALPGRTYQGRVTRVSPASVVLRETEQAIVRFPVEITITGDAAGLADLKTGMTADVEISCQRADNVLWVPGDALFQKDDQKDKWYVAVITGKQKGKLVTEDREVTKGLANDSRTEIRSGLEEDEEVELGKSGIPERRKFDIRRQSDRAEDEE
jgi:HlyD family secretion protein